jgi:AcrR family transcriptional regulator
MPTAQPREDSRTRFIDAADRVFIAEGYKGATIRAIAAEAKVSLATLNRHWPSKQDLFAEVFARHFDPIHQQQNQLLDALERSAAPGSGPTAHQIISAFFRPAIGAGGQGMLSVRRSVYCRALIEPSPEANRIIAKLIGGVRARVIDMLRRALPDLDGADFFLAINIVMGAYVFPQAFGHQLASAMQLDPNGLDAAMAADRLARFVARGLGEVVDVEAPTAHR